ncbi:uncharacterized protein PHALS_09474 [Plasmopara halstedii]|uniref:Uncharacterized protein n=1 Tax=Plasmopara halstedii TaxID=4781 RepID=A0A0P1A5E8_PLAHL|nr:uncharacterized protein PHALS_09474 [Plasmopara halstedii]CEG35348.1 hypothetical protein PHALS_09474 [Plasmopara halstedii]|eukprot:XP_024571717.1 hypothetical protein PHALS_09474 [Plasmopara halstedii]
MTDTPQTVIQPNITSEGALHLLTVSEIISGTLRLRHNQTSLVWVTDLFIIYPNKPRYNFVMLCYVPTMWCHASTTPTIAGNVSATSI